MDIAELYIKEIAPRKFQKFVHNRWEGSLAWRMMGFEAWRDGKASLGEAVLNLLPGRFRGNVNNLQNYFEDELMKIVSRLKDESELYKQKFYLRDPGSVKSWIDLFIFVDQIIISDQYHAKKFIKPDSVVIDAGANMGVFSVLAANLAPSGKVYSFEPTPETFELLKKNCEPYENIILKNMALGEATGQKNILYYKGSDGGNTIEDSGRTVPFGGKKANVLITTIDSLDLNRVDFIKMDIEGYEQRALRGAKETIRRYSPVISVSAYHHANDVVEIPKLIHSIDPAYKYNLYSGSEKDFVFWK